MDISVENPYSMTTGSKCHRQICRNGGFAYSSLAAHNDQAMFDLGQSFCDAIVLVPLLRVSITRIGSVTTSARFFR
jgi:hypothetical protein